MISRARAGLKSAAGALALVAGLAGPAFSQIEVAELQALDPLEVGLPQGALDNDLWAGSEAELAAIVLRALPDAQTGGYADDRAARLAASVLLSGGRPPEGGRGDAALAFARADRTLASSGVYAAHDLLERTPGLGERPDLARLHVETGFARFSPDTACRTAEALIEERQQVYWLRARAFCLFLQGQGAAAELTADLARSQAPEYDPDADFDRLLFALSLNQPPEGEPVLANSGLVFAMARMAYGATPEAAETAPAWLRRRAELAALDPVSPSLNPLADLEEGAAARGIERVRLLEGVLAQGRDRESSAAALALLLADAAATGGFVEAGLRYGAEVETLPVTGASLQHGIEFALAALISGDRRTAGRWRDALIDGPPRPEPVIPVLPGDPATPPLPDETPGEEWTPPAARLMMALDMALMTDGDLLGPGAGAIMAAWLESEGEAGLAEIAALTALGAPAPGGLRPALLARGVDQETPLVLDPRLAALDAAARAGARAETGLIAAAILNDEALMDADTLTRLAMALDAVGLREQALELIKARIIERVAARGL